MTSFLGIDFIDFEQTDSTEALLTEPMEDVNMFVENFGRESDRPTTAFNLSRQTPARPSVATFPSAVSATELPILSTYAHGAVFSMDPSSGQIFSIDSEFYGSANLIPCPLNNNNEYGVVVDHNDDVFEASNVHRSFGHDALTTNLPGELDDTFEKETTATISPSTVHDRLPVHSGQNTDTLPHHLFRAEDFDHASGHMGPCMRIWALLKLVSSLC